MLGILQLFLGNELKEGVFSDLRHSEAFEFFADRVRYEKRSSTAKGLLLGAFFSAEGPLSTNTFGKMTCKQA
jgi:hypothetical protein